MLMHEKTCKIPIFGVAPIGCGDLVLVLCYVVWFLVSFLAITLLRKRNVTDTDHQNSCQTEHILPYNLSTYYRVYLGFTELNDHSTQAYIRYINKSYSP